MTRKIALLKKIIKNLAALLNFAHNLARICLRVIIITNTLYTDHYSDL